MIIRFSIENFLSFRERQTFSLLPGKGTLKAEHKTTPVKRISALKTGVIFGANASGKTNLVKAMRFGKDMVLLGNKPGGRIRYDRFRLDDDCLEADSRLEFEIQHQGRNFAYGFVFNDRQIVEEWLYEVNRDSDRKVFERNTQAEEIFDLEPLQRKNRNREEQQFLQFVAKATPDNQLFLHEVATRKVSDHVSDISELLSVFDWFQNSLKIVRPEDRYRMGLRFELKDNDYLMRSFEEFLAYFDTGIDGVCLKETTPEKMDLPTKLIERVMEDLLDANSEDVRASIVSENRTTYFLSVRNKQVEYFQFMTQHLKANGEMALFDTKDESDGTNRIIDFIPLLMDLLQGDNVFVIDEMERSLHPNLIYEFMDLYLRQAKHINSQLILASHESSLITQQLLRKDEIWFVVKDQDGSSKLHSLEEYKVRFDKAIRKDYLLGRFRAVPRFGNPNELTVLS
ncbi:AAA family ATPase [Pontibacter sp. G13]|uniref:AAA family ATPase n=1 Tax=Pontibacter sp. G13 TaxID=3074898 RepID=UPI00288B5FFF|nr:AAA family ATPase [Pontibacter sp. G13]WNJ20561.1 AAA family ATPase [Pontibacter sp. G13]